MAMTTCPACGKKQFNPSSRRCYACKAEERPDGTTLTPPPGYVVDAYGNLRTPVVGEVKDRKLFVSFHYLLEPGKSTPCGEYPKIAQPPKCFHADRMSCNFGEGCARCQFMAHVGNGWACTATPT